MRCAAERVKLAVQRVGVADPDLSGARSALASTPALDHAVEAHGPV